ncbi:MAG TPA: ATP-binding protein [Polyangiaceae bacterium]|nr:ATP-binding protein [Polyangiaceae bacterium]
MSGARPSGERVTSRSHAPSTGASAERVGFVWGALTNVVTTTVAFVLSPYAALPHLMIIHLLGAVLISTRYGMAVSTFTAVTGVLAFDYFCIPPVFAFAMPESNVISFAGLMAIALLVCWLNQGVRYQRAAARASEERTQELCQLSLDLSQVTSTEELFSRAQSHLRELFGEHAELRVTKASPPPEPGFTTQVIRDHDRQLGYIRVNEDDAMLGRSDRGLLLVACADRIADALKLLALVDTARRAEVDTEVERNRNALLSAVSHDLKTPLASIMTAGSSLLSSAWKKDAPTRELLETIVQESERMNGLITNLLSATRLEAGRIVLKKEIEALDDLVFGVLSRLSGRLSDHDVDVNIPAALPMISVDAVLIDQLLLNLLENALRYAPSGSPIEIRGSAEDDAVTLEVCDRGPGIPAAEREQVFEKFYRGQAAKQNDGGTGLGLTICRAVVQAHGGSIAIFPRAGGGTRVSFTLPAGPAPALASEPPERRPTA